MAGKMVNVGIIGLGAAWEARYRPAVEKLRTHIKVCGIYDAVASRAAMAAAGFNAETSTGMLALAKRCDIHAVMILDTAWHGANALRMICRQGKPVYVAGWEAADYQTLLELYQLSREEGVTLMPELARRYTPATGRLRELIATRIGRPRQVTVDVTYAAGGPLIASEGCESPSLLAGWFDWCRCITGTSPASIRAHRPATAGGTAEPLHIEVQHAAFSDGTAGPRAEYVFRAAEMAAEHPQLDFHEQIQISVECEKGTARLSGPFDIAWSVGPEQRTENLNFERNATELMLGLFCRRVVGGLIPVADLKDACRGMKLQHSVCDSLSAGKPISLNGEV